VKLIVNADDFGRSSEINRAVIRAHREGILTSASLMITGAAAAEAVELANQNPRLAVGLHVVLVDGRPSLPPQRIAHLVDAPGRFPNAPARLGLRYFFHPKARGELAEELAAQFEAFARTGLPLSHVDGHQHLHMHPTVFKLLIPLAERYGARGVRVVRDDLPLALECDPRRKASKIVAAATFALLARSCRGRLRSSTLVAPSRCYGFFQSGRMTPQYVTAVLGRATAPAAEMYFHPTEGPRLDALGPNPEELETLLSPEVRAAVQTRPWELCTYADLSRHDVE
jgi:hopanoid biosynthesis associated protein HpnK